MSGSDDSSIKRILVCATGKLRGSYLIAYRFGEICQSEAAQFFDYNGDRSVSFFYRVRYGKYT